MFNFTTETIINSAYDNGISGLAKYAAGTDNYGSAIFKVSRVNNFLVSKIKGGVVYKTPSTVATKEVLDITVPSAANSTIYRLKIDMQLQGSVAADYARNFVMYGKPLLFEIKSDATATVTEIATAFVNLINNQNTQFGSLYVTAAVNAGKITLTCVNEYQRFKEVAIDTFAIDSNGKETYTNLVTVLRTSTGAGNKITTVGAEGFGTTTWMFKNLRLPTVDATRYFGINQEERPVVGGTYTQYSFEYSIDRDIRGLMAVGQEVKTTTTHIFYVLDTLVTAFETAMDTAGIIIGGPSFYLTTTDATNPVLDISNGDTCTVSAVGNPNGAVTYTSGTVGTATINSATGVVTLVAAGTTVITGTDAAGKIATITLTVQA